MEAILGTLGLNLTGFLWHSANFVLLLVLLWLVLFKPVTRMLDERTQRIEQSLARADEVRQAAERQEEERQQLMAEIRRESEQMRVRADEQAKRIVSEAEANAQQRATQILAQAEASIQASRQQMLTEVRAEVADLVVSAVERVTRGAVDANAQKSLIQQFLATEPGSSAVGRR